HTSAESKQHRDDTRKHTTEEEEQEDRTAVSTHELSRSTHRIANRSVLEDERRNRNGEARHQDQAGNDQQQEAQADVEADDDRQPEERQDTVGRTRVQLAQRASREALMLVLHEVDKRALHECRSDEQKNEREQACEGVVA